MWSQVLLMTIGSSATHLAFCSQLKQVMSWLVAHAPPATPLSCQTLQQLVEATLNHEFISRVYIEHQKRATAQLPSVHPSPVISLYNAVLTHIAVNVAASEMETLPPCEFWQPESPEFVPYLGWNFVHHQAWIRKAILSLQLPQWEDLSTTGQWWTTNTTKSQFMVLLSNKKCETPKFIYKSYMLFSFSVSHTLKTHGQNSALPSLVMLPKCNSQATVNRF